MATFTKKPYQPETFYPYSIGLELTFLPRKRGKWQEWRSLEEAQDVTRTFNRLLWEDDYVRALSLLLDKPAEHCVWGKADIFRAPEVFADQPHKAWCLEVNNAPVSAPELLGGTLPEVLYRIAASLGLHPKVQRRKRDGTLVDYPNGGGHQHFGLDLWTPSSSNLLMLYIMEKNLCIDYANRPFIRWLLSHWSDNTNSTVAIGPSMFAAIADSLREGKPPLDTASKDQLAHDRALNCNALEQRLSHSSKATLPTLEFRFLDMPSTPAHARLHTAFLCHWMDRHRVYAEQWADHDTHEKALKEDLHFTLTAAKYRRLTRDLPYARAQIEAFLEEIGLKPQIYLDAFWEECYVRRMKWGKAL
jgi:hypothetical protein